MSGAYSLPLFQNPPSISISSLWDYFLPCPEALPNVYLCGDAAQFLEVFACKCASWVDLFSEHTVTGPTVAAVFSKFIHGCLLSFLFLQLGQEGHCQAWMPRYFFNIAIIFLSFTFSVTELE